MKKARVRQKICGHCGLNFEVLYRVRLDQNLPWIFLCGSCQNNAKLEHKNYMYGGTWKASKRH